MEYSSDSCKDAFVNADCHTDSDTHSVPLSDNGNTNPYTNADTGVYRTPYSDANPDIRADRGTDRNSDSYGNPDADTDPYSDAGADNNSDG